MSPPAPIPQHLPAYHDRSGRSSKTCTSRLVAHRRRIVVCKYFKLCLPEILREKTGSGIGTTSQAPILMSGVGVWRALVREKAGMAVLARRARRSRGSKKKPPFKINLKAPMLKIQSSEQHARSSNILHVVLEFPNRFQSISFPTVFITNFPMFILAGVTDVPSPP
jgi:hypothetical protein